MPALKATGLSARISWLGIVPDRVRGLSAELRQSLDLTFAGPTGEAHAGLTRPACSRLGHLYPRDHPIRNTRQLSILSAEDLATIGAAMGLDAPLDAALLGATLVLEGLPDVSHLPPSSRLLADGGACLVVDMENRPCTLPARPIEDRHPGLGRRFKAAAAGRRGVTAWVEAEGRLAVGDRLSLFIPDQPAWTGAVAPKA